MNPLVMKDIPLIAYGTWVDNINDAPLISTRVRDSIELGYTHIDTAIIYGTESYAIQGINESGISRDNIYVTSKIRSIENVENLRMNLGHLQYYDLLLLHYPPLDTYSRDIFKEKVLSLWIGMERYLRSGLTKAIGVSNFYQNHLELLLEVCDENNLILPLVNQIEIHLGNLELAYVPYMQSKGIIPFAHTPLGGLGAKYILNNDILSTIATRIGATPAQVVLAYLLKRNIGVVTSSKNLIHMNESIHSPEFISALTIDDMNAINSTDMGMGPIIQGSQYSWDDNSRLY